VDINLKCLAQLEYSEVG